MSSSEFKGDPSRDATDSIRGYVYQAYQSVLAWMQLKDGELLVLEGAEDFDVHSGSSVLTTQVKDLSGNITLRSGEILDSLNNFWTTCESNPDYEVVFRFLTTANIGQEQHSPFGKGKKGLDYWRDAESEEVELAPLKTFLGELNLHPGLREFLRTATDDDIREKLIRRIKWDTGTRATEGLQYLIEDKLKVHGVRFQITPLYSRQVLPHLLRFVADLLSKKGRKELRLGDFLSCFEEATAVSVPRGRWEAMTAGAGLQQLAHAADLLELASLAAASSEIGSPLPAVDGGIPRTKLVAQLTERLCQQEVLFLHGSSGLGKTNLASLLSERIGGSWGWGSFRGQRPEQTKSALARASFDINQGRLLPFLVLDDVDLGGIYLFERELISVIASVLSSKGMVVITSQVPPPLGFYPKIWRDESCEVSVPYFDENDIYDLVVVHGLIEPERASGWARAIWLTTSGHPQLVHARTRNLEARGWPSIQVSELTRPEDIERVKSQARARLVKEFPSEDARVLAYRLSIVTGAFSRQTAMALGDVPPHVRLAGDLFDSLVGPWIERESNNQYRISPLLKGAADQVLSRQEIVLVHAKVAQSIVNQKVLNQLELGTALFHAVMAKEERVLLKLAMAILTMDEEHERALHQALSWFFVVALEPGQKILPGKPETEVMIRLAQYKLTNGAGEAESAIKLIARIEESLNEVRRQDRKEHLEVLAYGKILNSLTMPLGSPGVVKMLSRLIDLENSPALMAVVGGLKGKDGPRVGENTPAQLLFSYEAARIGGLDDLRDLILALDDLPLQKRSELLKVCDAEFDFSSLLISQSWWKDAKNNVLDVEKAVSVLGFVEEKAKEWNAPRIVCACVVALAVIYDEYGRAPERALAVLDVASQSFPNDAGLLNQRAKVLFHSNRNAEALPIAQLALDGSGLSDVEFVFCCRLAGIASARIGDWIGAERLFLRGWDRARNTSVQKAMGVGLMADAAFATWKAGERPRCLSMMADVLDLLGTIPLTDEIRVHHLHATVRHLIAWFHFQARGDGGEGLAEPIPGMCSNQEPHEGIREHRVIDITGAWGLLSATEAKLQVDGGIRARAEAATAGKRPLVIAEYERASALETLFDRKTFLELVPVTIGVLEGIRAAQDLGRDMWTQEEIERLPPGYWEDFKNWDFFCHLMLAATLVAVDAEMPIQPIIERWREDLKKAGALSERLEVFLNALDRGASGEALYEVAAGALYQLRVGILAPKDLWIASFRLLNAFMNNAKWVEDALDRLLVERWMFAAGNQRFAFSAPNLICGTIDGFCKDATRAGLPRVAAVLLETAPFLSISLSGGAKKMLSDMQKAERS